MSTPNPVARRAAILLRTLLGPTRAKAVAEQLDQARLLAAPTVRVGRPYPISIRRTGLGVELDHHALMTALLAQLAEQYSEDPDGVGYQLGEIADATGGERDALLETLLDSLGGATQNLGATAARELADRITDAAGPAFPHQQDRRHTA